MRELDDIVIEVALHSFSSFIVGATLVMLIVGCALVVVVQLVVTMPAILLILVGWVLLLGGIYQLCQRRCAYLRRVFK